MTAPDFVIAGAMRCGTTSLTAFLRSRSDIGLSVPKELHYFDRQYERGMEWYSEQFKPTHGEVVMGEATPNYLYDPDARARMARDLDSARFVILLRNPVDRAYSHYWLAREGGRETLSFESAIRAEPRRLAHADPLTASYVSYLDRGRYVDQIKDLVRHAGAERVGVWIFEEICEDPDNQLRQVLRFLGGSILASERLEFPVINDHRRVRSPWIRTRTRGMPKRVVNTVAMVNTVRRPYPPMPKDLRVELESAFASQRVELEEFLGRPIHAWVPHS